MKRDHDVIWDFAMKVNEYCPGSLGWIAKQRVSETQPFDDLYGFVIGKGFTSIRVEGARNADDAVVRQAATDIMGYAPESVEDWLQREAHAEKELRSIEQQITDLKRWESHWAGQRGKALSALVKLATAQGVTVPELKK